MKNALTFDLEDWNHPELVKNHAQGNQPQIVQSTEQVLKLLDKYKVKATFFIVGEIAEKNPNLIRQIYSKGHEIASHGMSHTPLWELNYYALDKDLKTFKKLMKSILGENVKIIGFRAPTFSLDNTTKYGLKCLLANDFTYDSSIFPVRTPLYGIKHAPISAYKPNTSDLSLNDNSSKIVEFPLTVFKIWRIKIPVCGGFYLRITPYFILKTLLRKINQKRAFVIFVHPWETYKETPRLRKIGLTNYLITYFCIETALEKLERLLKDFKFDTMSNVIKTENEAAKDYVEVHTDRFNDV